MAQDNKIVLISGKYEGSQANFSGGTVIEICFNPSEYTLDKSNTFSEATIPGLDSPIIQFSSGQAQTLSLELLLDTYTYEKGEDIRTKYIEKLEKLVEIDGKFHAPPPCKVLWSSLEFVGVLEKMTKKYVLFKDNGTPVRARVNLSFKEYKPVEIQLKQSPRSSPDKYKKYVMIEGDSLWHLAYKAYGKAAYWRVIAEANAIDDPLLVEAGTEIRLPPLESN